MTIVEHFSRDKLFICYHETEKKFRDEIDTSLNALSLVRDGVLHLWDESMLGFGAIKDEEIADAIEQTRVAVVLLSSSFLANDLLFKVQLGALIEAADLRLTRLMPVFADHCLIPPELERFVFVNPRTPASGLKPTERKKLWVDLARAIEDEYKSQAESIVAPVHSDDGGGSIVAAVHEDDEEQASAILKDLEDLQGLEVKVETWPRSDDPGARQQWVSRLRKPYEIQSLIVFIGGAGLRPWTEAGLYSSLRRFTRSGKPLTVVLLPGRPADWKSPTFLSVDQVLDVTSLDGGDSVAEELRRRLLSEAEVSAQAPEVPTEPTPPEHERTPEEIETEVAEAIEYVEKGLERGEHLTFFVGSGVYPIDAGGSGNAPRSIPPRESTGAEEPPTIQLHPLRLSAITHCLLDQLELDYREVLPPVDVVSDYFDIRTRTEKGSDTGAPSKNGTDTGAPSKNGTDTEAPSENGTDIEAQAEFDLDSMLKQLCMDAAKTKPTTTHELIANSIEALVKRQKDSDPFYVTRRPVTLIVTTNFDLMMERALLEAGVAFTRIVQHRSGDMISVNEYRNVTRINRNKVRIRTDGVPYDQWRILMKAKKNRSVALDVKVEEEREERTVAVRDVTELYDAIEKMGIRNLGPVADGEGLSELDAFDLERFTPPYLYKYHGSVDIDGSCAVTTEQYFKFLRAVHTRKIIPDRIKTLLTSGSILFFGYGVLDPDFRITAHTLLRDPQDLGRRFAIHPTPHANSADRSERVEHSLWSKLRIFSKKSYDTRILETTGDEFLEKFIERI